MSLSTRFAPSGRSASWLSSNNIVILATVMMMMMTASSAIRRTTTTTAWIIHRRPAIPRNTWFRTRTSSTTTTRAAAAASTKLDTTNTQSSQPKKGKILVLGGTGFLGQQVCQTALQLGYHVVSLSRRGLPPSRTATTTTSVHDDDNNNHHQNKIEYRRGDARQQSVIFDILNEEQDNNNNNSSSSEPFVAIVHCIGLLFDDASGLANLNRFVSGSGSVPDSDSTYETITRITAFQAMEAATQYAVQQEQKTKRLAFVFTSAAEAGWPDVPGGAFIEANLAPDFLKRYLAAKRTVEAKLLSSLSSSSSSSLPEQQQPPPRNPPPVLRPIIVRPSLIYSLDRPASFLPVGAFFMGNKLGLPFVDRPVTVQHLATAILRAIQDESVQGILRYPQIDALAAADTGQ